LRAPSTGHVQAAWFPDAERTCEDSRFDPASRRSSFARIRRGVVEHDGQAVTSSSKGNTGTGRATVQTRWCAVARRRTRPQAPRSSSTSSSRNRTQRRGPGLLGLALSIRSFAQKTTSSTSTTSRRTRKQPPSEPGVVLPVGDRGATRAPDNGGPPSISPTEKRIPGPSDQPFSRNHNGGDASRFGKRRLFSTSDSADGRERRRATRFDAATGNKGTSLLGKIIRPRTSNKRRTPYCDSTPRIHSPPAAAEGPEIYRARFSGNPFFVFSFESSPRAILWGRLDGPGRSHASRENRQGSCSAGNLRLETIPRRGKRPCLTSWADRPCQELRGLIDPLRRFTAANRGPSRSNGGRRCYHGKKIPPS